ncbi:peptide/nickel transport system substrate-binding protein [Sediminihabitans luteus]|uniref:Peptide/nickel transport system substrate-binding protein n=1 Tax=Sediminihabitans luteus TaxID=1138585 RepID=A0A2M9D008_9CELL|nr:ABC transporter substrate-binding protein [Sediminihabitans luteus]PJJ77524.1 peptide/nickel transport system substrate-binding protein [Sediminihabitans luteus]GII98423.1 peptide ABC transporter substrate-binding protein [Sediminihabitans luteus]
MKIRTLSAVAVGALSLALVASGCSGSSDDPKTTTTSASGTSQGTQALTIGMPNGPQTNNSNPFLNTSAARSLGYAFAIYEPLAQVNDTRPSQDPIPWLAKAFEWNEDYTQLTLTARDGVTWSDGEDFTAEDIAFSLQMRKDNDALNTEGLPYGDITTDGDTVTVTFTSGQFVNQIKVLQMFVVPKHIWEGIADPSKDTNQEPVGTGPYTLTSWTNQAVTLDANPDYWGGELAAPQLQYTSYSGNDTLTPALATGQAQWGWTFIADYENTFIAKDPENNLAYFPAGLGIDMLVLNTTKAPFDDVAVRQAANMVVDREKASKIAESGIFPELTSITAIPTPAGDDFIADEYKDQSYEVDVEGAKKVLTDAGYTYDGDKLIGKDGQQVSVTLQDPSGWNDYITSLQLISDSLQSIGFAVKVETPNADAWTANLNSGNFDAALHWTNGGVTPYEMYANMFDPAYYAPVGENASWNYGRYQDDDAAAQFVAYTDATDDAGRKAALDALQKIYVEDVPVLGIDARPAGAEFSQKFYTGWPSDDDDYANPQPTTPGVSLILTKLQPAS